MECYRSDQGVRRQQLRETKDIPHDNDSADGSVAAGPDTVVACLPHHQGPGVLPPHRHVLAGREQAAGSHTDTQHQSQGGQEAGRFPKIQVSRALISGFNIIHYSLNLFVNGWCASPAIRHVASSYEVDSNVL